MYEYDEPGILAWRSVYRSVYCCCCFIVRSLERYVEDKEDRVSDRQSKVI